MYIHTLIHMNIYEQHSHKPWCMLINKRTYILTHNLIFISPKHNIPMSLKSIHSDTQIDIFIYTYIYIYTIIYIYTCTYTHTHTYASFPKCHYKHSVVSPHMAVPLQSALSQVAILSCFLTFVKYSKAATEEKNTLVTFSEWLRIFFPSLSNSV